MSEVISLPTPKNVANRGFCLTPTAQRICAVLEICRTGGIMSLISGPPGVGKTAAAKEFVRSNPRTAYCSVIRAACNLQAGLTRVADAIGAGLGVRNASPRELHDDIVRYVSTYGLELLILDEIQIADDELLEAMRNLYDACGLAVAFIGDEMTTARFESKGKRSRGTFQPVLGRTLQTLSLKDVRPEDVAALCTHHGISSEARPLVKELVSVTGGLHRFDGAMRIAASRAAGGVINHGHVLEASRMMGVQS